MRASAVRASVVTKVKLPRPNFGLVAAGDMDTTVISTAMIYMLLKQLYCDAGFFLKNSTQSVYKSISHFSRVRNKCSFNTAKVTV